MNRGRGFCLAILSCAVIQTGSCSEPSPARSRLGINLAGLTDWGTEHPFVDVFRLSRKWISQRQGEGWGRGPELTRDKHGWITRLEDNCFAETPLLTHGHAPTGTYVCLYEGEGELDFKNNAKVVSRQPGRIEVEIDGAKGGVFLSLRKTNPANYVRNIRVIMPGFEKTWREQAFHPAFLKRWSAFNTYRFMDWQETNNSEQEDWGRRPLPEDCNWTERGAPVEIMVELCNRQRVNPWFCLPHRANDESVRQFARLVKSRLDPVLKVHVEYSNEVWNGMFGQNKYAQEQGKLRKLGEPARPWEGAGMFHAERSTEIFRIWEQEFGSHERLVRVVAWQAGGDWWTDKILLPHKDTAQHCDALAIAPYISMIMSPRGKPSSDTVSQWSLHQVLDYAETNALPECLRWMRAQKQVADKYKLKLMAYEAGQHLVGAGGGENNDQLTKLFIEANRHPRMGKLYEAYLDGWRSAGGDLCCIFSSTATPSKWGSWGLLEHALEERNPKYNAVLGWNARNPARQ
jgi:hypothetical protein